MRPKPSAAAVGLGMLGLGVACVLSCVDPMVVGNRPACEPQCPAEQHCNLELEQCVQCTTDEDCVGRLNAPYCEGFGCTQCRTTEDCAGDRLCASGACVECVQNADCNAGGHEPFETHVCELGACVDRF